MTTTPHTSHPGSHNPLDAPTPEEGEEIAGETPETSDTKKGQPVSEEFQEDETPVYASSVPKGQQLVLDLEGYDGPIDMLLGLARDQKVDLTQISILALANQYLDFIETAKNLRIELAADYLVMAAWLA